MAIGNRFATASRWHEAAHCLLRTTMVLLARLVPLWPAALPRLGEPW